MAPIAADSAEHLQAQHIMPNHEEEAKHEKHILDRISELPAELRNEIYELMVPKSCEIRNQADLSYGRQLWPMQVSRHLKAALVPLFYGTNTFILNTESSKDSRDACDWLEQIADDGFAALRKLRIVNRVECDCFVKLNYYQRLYSKRDYFFSLAITIDKDREAKPYDVAIKVCGHCRNRHVGLVGAIRMFGGWFQRDEQGLVIDRRTLLNVCRHLQTLSSQSRFEFIFRREDL